MRINIDSIGDDLYNAYNEGFGDGKKEIIGIVEEFKESHKYNVGSRALRT